MMPMSYSRLPNRHIFVSPILLINNSPKIDFMKRILASIAFLFAWLGVALAQTVTVSPTSVVIANTSPAGNVIKPLESCYFAYKTTDSTFQVFDERNIKIFDSDCDDLTTVAADSTTALKIARIAKYCLPVRTSSTWYYYFPKGGDLTYTATTEKVRLKNGRLDFTFQIDSITGGTYDTTTALLLTFLKNEFNRPANLQLSSAGGASTIAAGAAAGSSPTVSVSGNAVAGTITISTGTSAATGVLATVTLPVTFQNGCTAVLTPADSDAAAAAAKIFVTSTSSTVVINVGTSALADSTQFKWTYTVIGN